MALAIGEIVFMVWAWQRVEEWLRSPEAAAAAELQRELAEHLWPLLRALQRLYPLPSKVSDLIAVSVPLIIITNDILDHRGVIAV